MRFTRCCICGVIYLTYKDSDICDCCLDDMRDEEVDNDDIHI